MRQAVSQSIPFSEIICYNDGGTDGSAKVAQQLGARVIESGTNSRQSYARNRLLEAARSPYVHFHDVDDPLNHQFLEKLTPLLRPDTVVISSLRQVEVDGTEIVHDVSRCADLDLITFAIKYYTHLNAAILPRENVMRVGGFDEELTLYEEILLLQRLVLCGTRLSFYGEEVIAEWIKHQHSFMHSHSWTENAAMLDKYACRSLQLFKGTLHETEIAEYLFQKCFEYYRYDKNVLPILLRIMARLNASGYKNIIGISDKVRLLSTFFPRSVVLRLHRWWSDYNSRTS
jgi:glycosyltransferase involved in cell wall biosynthesis